jgi:heme-degrading monooxygenase HmoA
MIVRIWRGRAESGGADAYQHHFTDRVLDALAAIPGNCGAHLLRREVDGAVEFLAVTLWESMDAIRQFAGPDPDVAVVEPEARAVLSGLDDFVRHYELAASSSWERGPPARP